VTPVTAEPAQRGTPSVLELPGASDRLRARLTDGLNAVNDLIELRVDH
jgi:heptaprenyl diphosphate synthase